MKKVLTNLSDGDVLFLDEIHRVSATVEEYLYPAMEEEDTILDIYEPYLMQCGFLERTPKGRVASRMAYEHLGLKNKNGQSQLI